MHNRTRAGRAAALVAVALTALTLGGTAPAVSDQPASTDAAARPVAPPHLDPATLSRGADPQIPYLLRHTLHDGDRSIRVAKAPNHIDLYETRRGYVVVDNFPRRQRTFRITSISDAGERRVIARPQGAYSTAVSPRGTRLAWSDRVGDLGIRSIVKVVDPHTGRRIARRVFQNADVIAVTARRVLLSRSRKGDNTTTAWWNYRRNTVREVSQQQGLRADVRADALVLANRTPSACTRVVRVSNPAHKRYRSCWITPHAWSPDGRHAMATNIYFDMPGTDRWVVTDARTGERRARVTGRLDWDVAWEDNRHFLTMAQSDKGKAAVIRCDLQARCERAGRLWDRAVDEDEYFVGPPVLLASN